MWTYILGQLYTKSYSNTQIIVECIRHFYGLNMLILFHKCLLIKGEVNSTKDVLGREYYYVYLYFEST